MRTLTSVFDQFAVARTNGLSADQVTSSRMKYGANRLTPLPRLPVWKKFLEKFDEPIIKILLAATLLKITVDLFTGSPLLGLIGLLVVTLVYVSLTLTNRTEWLPTSLFVLALVLFLTSLLMGQPSIEGLAVLVAVALATGVAFLSEYRSDQEFEKLNARKDTSRVKTVRDGEVMTVSLEEVVVGDLILLEPGDEISADGRIVKANELMIDQSLMTGESEPAKKRVQGDNSESDSTEHTGCVYRGTQVVDGLGQMIATNVGDDTMLGQIARRLSGEEAWEVVSESDSRVQRKLALSKEATPLQQKLTRLASSISRLGYIAAGAIFVVLLVRGLFFTTPAEVFWPKTIPEALLVAKALLGYIVYMVIVIVVAVPEGLPMSVTVSLALAMRKMTRANALVRQLVATETIGSATVICSDKTGTLTQNRMKVERIGIDGQVVEIGNPKFSPTRIKGERAGISSTIDWLVVNSALNSTSSLETKGEKTLVVGSSTEGALLLWLRDTGINYSAERLHHPVCYRSAFSSEQKKMTTVAEVGQERISFVKGAPEVILSRCRYQFTIDGQVREMQPGDKTAIEQQIVEAAMSAMRTLAFAHKRLPEDFPDEQEGISDRRQEFETDLVFDGFVAIRDPLRPDIHDSIEQCRSAGIEVKMITGDNLETARAIATEIGLLASPTAELLTSEEFNSFSDEELKARLPNLRVLARAKPLDKYRMVKLLQEQNHVVAMTGDGTNDAPSLKKADVGLAMGIAGTEVAKEASKIVLLDDAFGTIVKAVHWGRSLYENIQRFIQFQLTINLSALTIAFLGPFLGQRPPFTVLQLLWINVIMDTFAAIALCSEPPRAGLMAVPPKRRDENIITRSMFTNIVVTGGFFVVVMMTLLVGMQQNRWFGGESISSEFHPLTVRQVTIFFTVYVFLQVWNQINCRSLTHEQSGLRGLFRNRLFLLIASVTVVGQVLLVTFGGSVFAVEPLDWLDWLVIALATSGVLVFAEVSRVIRRASRIS
jgi:P-type Ca2+ transporter type 2C